MCGIAGAFGRDAPDRGRVNATLAALARRGPDGDGVHVDRLRGLALTLLHTRLAIIDLDDRAAQPFAAEDCVLVFNGEIYNYVELRRELEALGHRFATASDTEVLLRAYRQWGAGCTARLEGMWAFALLDRRDGLLILSRDRFGEKPLYLMQDSRPGGATVYFASEVKALAALSGRHPAVDRQQIRRYLVNGYKALYKQPATWFSGISELPPGTTAVIEDPGTVRPERYWTLAYRPVAMSMEDAVAGVRERLRRAVEIRLRADVPVAFCLSGGVDSSLLAAIAAKELGAAIHAFSIVDRDPRYDERDNIGPIVDWLGCDHHVTHTTTEGFFDRLGSLVAYHDAPVATISYYVHAFLSEAIRASGYKVAISGTGADELFTGYYDHYSFWLAEMAGRPEFERLLDDWRGGYGASVRNPLLQDPLAFARNPGERAHIYLDRDLFNDMLAEPLAEDFVESAYSANTLRNRMQNEMFHEVVPVILHEDDRNSMRCSIENRSPYLDRALAEFAFSVPNKHLIHDGFAKWLLRSAADGLLPDPVRLDKRKRGFNASIDSLLDRRDPQTRERLLADGPIFEIVRRDKIAAFLDTDMTDNSLSKFLFSFVSAKLFLESDLAAGRSGPSCFETAADAASSA